MPPFDAQRRQADEAQTSKAAHTMSQKSASGSASRDLSSAASIATSLGMWRRLGERAARVASERDHRKDFLVTLPDADIIDLHTFGAKKATAQEAASSTQVKKRREELPPIGFDGMEQYPPSLLSNRVQRRRLTEALGVNTRFGDWHLAIVAVSLSAFFILTVLLTSDRRGRRRLGPQEAQTADHTEGDGDQSFRVLPSSQAKQAFSAHPVNELAYEGAAFISV